MKADDPHQYIRMSNEVTMRHNESYWWRMVTHYDSKIVKDESRRSSSICKSKSWCMSHIKWIMVTHQDAVWLIMTHSDSWPEVGIFTTESDSVPDLQPIYNRFSFDHRFKIGCNSVNENFGQQPIYNRCIVTMHCDSFWLTVTPISLTLMGIYPNPNGKLP